MTSLVLTIDSGTSNTRARAWRGDRLVGAGDASVGVRDTARSGTTALLEAGVRDAVASALRAANADAPDLVLASGMITSGLGLLEVPHIQAPAGIVELASALREKVFPSIATVPIWFVPGVRCGSPPAQLATVSTLDMMRGEETETIGLIERARPNAPFHVLFPGSHAKFIAVDASARITTCLTTLSGELIESLAQHTVLASGLREGWPATIDEAALIEGARLSRRDGLSRAAFATRVLEVLGDASGAARFSFLLGAVLAQDLSAYVAWRDRPMPKAARLLVCGRPIVQSAYGLLARMLFELGDVTTPAQDTLEDLAAIGAMAIARQRGLP
jgi:2-dehydro-3-deoxygalactonokinase